MADETRTIVIVGQGGIQTDLELDTLAEADIADAIPDLLVDYSAECKDWTIIAREHWRCERWARAEDLLLKGIKFFGGSGRPDHMALVNLHAMLAHLHLSLSRHAPKLLLPNAKYDVLSPETRTKEYHWTEATSHLNRADQALRASGAGPEEEPVSMTMGKVILYLARAQPQLANPLVEQLLQRQPNNLAALTAQARLQFARRQHDTALLTYQTMLQLSPDMQPDPRIGLGICAYQLGDKIRARAAWDRAIQLNPDAWVPILLIGLSSMNMARDPSQSAEKRLQCESEGVSYVQRAFKLNPKNTAAALALTAVAGLGGNISLASKLAERAIQFSDNKRHTIAANAERGRLGFMAGDVIDATPYISAAKSEDPGVNVLAELTLAQIAIKNGALRDALNFVEQTARRIGGKGPLEFTVLHASLLAFPHPGMPADEMARNLQTARNMLTEVQGLYSKAATEEDWVKLRGIAQDADVFTDLAKLWQEESLEKAITAYQTAISIKREDDEDEDDKAVDYSAVRLSTNLASLYAIQGEVDAAERMFQESIQRMGAENGKEADMLKTVIAYDLGRANEQGGDSIKATQWYRDVLRQHPEHVDSKIRLAAIASAAGRNVEAHNYLKDCLRADESNINVRSAFTNFLISIGSYKEALNFTGQTRAKYDNKDAFTYTALGWLHYTLGREAKSTADLAERSKQYLRSAEAYERALSIDPTNAVAAQGLAIALAEDTLTPKALQQQPGSVEDLKTRTRQAGQALTVLGRIKDSLPEGAVNVNIGHCYFIRGEEERAIEAYGAALIVYGPHRVNVLLYLSRAWYAYANKESNFSAMGQALSYAQKAMHVQPSDRAILYNIAMIQQKGAEIMLALDPARRTLDELRIALKHAEESINTFRGLADDKSGPLPYDAEIADQRSRYGENLLQNQGPKQIEVQEAYEGDTAARVEEARRLRAEEQARIEAAAAERQAKIDARAAELAEERRKARDEAREWQEQLAAQLVEEEQRKADRSEQRKRKKDADIIDDAEEDGEDRPRRKRKSGKKRKARSKSEATDDGMDVDGSEEEEDVDGARRSALAKLKAGKKKRAPRADPDEEGGKRGSGKIKSKAIIEDSDEEAEDYGASEPGTATEDVTATATANATAEGTPAPSSPVDE